MSDPFRISDLRFTPSPTWWQDKGLLGWASGVLDDSLGVGGIGVRRTRGGGYTLTFPGEKDRNGNLHHHLWPRDEETRRAFETQIFGELRRRGVLP